MVLEKLWQKPFWWKEAKPNFNSRSFWYVEDWCNIFQEKYIIYQEIGTQFCLKICPVFTCTIYITIHWKQVYENKNTPPEMFYGSLWHYLYIAIYVAILPKKAWKPPEQEIMACKLEHCT